MGSYLKQHELVTNLDLLAVVFPAETGVRGGEDQAAGCYPGVWSWSGDRNTGAGGQKPGIPDPPLGSSTYSRVPWASREGSESGSSFRRGKSTTHEAAVAATAAHGSAPESAHKLRGTTRICVVSLLVTNLPKYDFSTNSEV